MCTHVQTWTCTYCVHTHPLPTSMFPPRGWRPAGQGWSVAGQCARVNNSTVCRGNETTSGPSTDPSRPDLCRSILTTTQSLHLLLSQLLHGACCCTRFVKLICRGGTASACCSVSSLGRRLRGSRATGGEVSSTPPSPQPVEWAQTWAEAETSETWSDTHIHTRTV